MHELRKPSGPVVGLPLTLLLGTVLLGTALLVGCGAATTTSGSTSTGTAVTDPLTFQNSAMPAAYVGENFSTSVAVLGGVGPYGYRVVSGSLPPGLKLSGASLSGTPTTTGPYKFTVEVTDANLSSKVQEYTVNVNTLPPLSIEAELPKGQIRGETRVPMQIRAARSVRAARVIWDLGANVKVTRIQPTDPSNVVIWKQEGSVLTLDLGFKTVPRSDTRIALVSVKPDKVVTLNTTNFWYDSRDAKGQVLGEKKQPAPAPAVDPKLDPKATPGAATPSPAPTDPGKTAAPKAETPAAVPANTAPANATPANTAPAQTDPAKTDSTGQSGTTTTDQPASGQPASGGTTPTDTTPPPAEPAPGGSK